MSLFLKLMRDPGPMPQPPLDQVYISYNDLLNTLGVKEHVSGVTTNAPLPGTSIYDHSQTTPESFWVINHNLGLKPSVSVFDSSGSQLLADVINTSANQTTIAFNYPTAGFARLT